MRKALYAIIICSIISPMTLFAGSTEEKTWSAIQLIEFTKEELPSNLYSMFTENMTESYIQYCLPASYSKSKNYPLIVYVPGLHGGPGGNIEAAKDIGNNHGCVVASLPLFKAGIDRSEVGNGILVSLSDYNTISKAYNVMLKKFFQIIPNIDKSKSSMVGFSNGAITIAVLVSSHDKYILEKFQNFCLVDHGMFHLTDLHKKPTRDRRFLILVGDMEGFRRDLKIRGSKLVADSYQLLGINIESRILNNTGHELTSSCKTDIGEWIFNGN